MNVIRRQLQFANLDEVISEIENLHTHGYDRAGNWDLGQVIGHLIEWMRFPMDGFPPQGVVIRSLMLVLRTLVGRAQLRKVLQTRTLPTGGPTVRETIPVAGNNASELLESMKSLVARVKAHDGKIHPSPFFGAMTRDEWIQLNLIHCAHHLSFLVPKSS